MFLSPPQSPSAPGSPRLSPTRPAGLGHRRGGSEFVGGKIRDGEAITVLNPSPTRPDGSVSPSLQPTRPRRGHAHRRSAAISSHDLSSIIIPPSNLGSRKGDSAPASPNTAQQPTEMKLPAPMIVTPEPQVAVVTPSPKRSADRLSSPPTPASQGEQTPKSNARNRVGFSDTLEYIPRPVSMVSTDTSSTVTARPGHSVSGSISSIVSITERDANPVLSAPRKTDESRPSTAGAIMERGQATQEQDPSLQLPRRRGSIPLLGALPASLPLSPSTPSPIKTSKKWPFFSGGRDQAASGSPTRIQPDSPRSTVSHLSMLARNSLDRVRDAAPETSKEKEETATPVTKKRSKKQKKVKTWAGTILSRKGKHRHGKHKKRAPTPPPPRPLGEEEDDADAASLQMASEPELGGSQSPENEDWKSWTFPKPAPADDDTSYPMIDLDAALGPFNTPLPRNPEWEAAQRAGGLHKKQLHSAAGMSRFSGPGMHYYHRRAESAPELAPFEGGRFGFRRFGSSSTMADVFEEDEEEEEESATNGTKPTPAADASAAPEKPKDDESHKTSQATTQADEAVPPSTAPTTQDKVIASDAASKAETTASTQPTIPSDSDIIFVDPMAPFMREAPGTPPCSAMAYSDGTPSPRQVCRPKDLAPVDVSPLNLPSASLGPASPWSMSSSAFPSPRSPMSYDAQCISTAPSSITEDNFQSLLMGEPGPEVRISVDDIPSLTSSNSTMTRESLFAHNPQARNPPLSADLPRPASFTGTAFGRRRSSLASLSRLINSSHGERSKLSIEVTADNDQPSEKKNKASKAKRLSRMMQFWKPKEEKTA
jgi:hypothetical protein